MRTHFSLVLGLATVLITVGASCGATTDANTTTTKTNSTPIEKSGTNGSTDQSVNTSVIVGADSSEKDAAATTGTISISSFAFSAATLTVAPSATITVTNNDSAPHSVTANDDSFDTGLLAKGKSATFTAPSTPGTYTYFCTAHPSMKGTLIVK